MLSLNHLARWFRDSIKYDGSVTALAIHTDQNATSVLVSAVITCPCERGNRVSEINTAKSQFCEG
ncbi:UNVERIFIED_CONTAM: hypothetical protein FKN15_072575 [Acipenser sinensis]